jgi:hypothetical protein
VGLLVGLVMLVVGAIFLYAIIQSAVRSGVEEALRNHHVWANGDDGQEAR